jgi:DNA (cytosine-5)-methyltransferase 1
MIRHRVRNGLRDPYDERRDLWRSFLEVVKLARPPAVLMENVPDMALDKEMFILRSMVHELESLGYAVEERVVDTFRYGVPQFRQRLILVALRDAAAFDWPEEQPERVTVWNAIGDLPAVEGGWRPPGGADGWADYEGPISSFQARMREGVPDGDTHKVFDHITRPVRKDDLRAFELMDATTRYSDLPEGVKRYRDDIFDDKYKRLDENDLSRTITAHIAKDGYWYIHPRQNRTITVRTGSGSPARPQPHSGRSATLSRRCWRSGWLGPSRRRCSPPARRTPPHARSPRCWRDGSTPGRSMASPGCAPTPGGW